MALMSTVGDDDTDYNAAVASGDIRNVFAVLEKENGLPAGYLAKTAKVESGMNPNAQNPRSSAGGLFQFINSTAKRYGLTDKMDPVASSLAAAQLAGDNKDYLASKIGRDPTDVELYAAHQQGAGGAAKIIANPGAPMTSLVGSEAARLNAASNLTGGQFIDRFASKFGSPAVGGGTRTVSTAATPEADMPAADAVPTSGFQRGAMADAYKPEEEGWNVPVGNTISAIGQALLSGTRQSPLSSLPQIMAQQKALADKREDRRYGMYKDNRDFGFRQTESDRAQANTDRGFGLQTEQFGLTKSNTAADNDRADAQLQLQKDNAAKPDRVTTADGGVVELPKDGSAPVVRIPGQKIQTESGKVAERRELAKGIPGLDEGTPQHSQYLLNGKLPEGVSAAPTTRNIKQADGSEIAVQWDGDSKKWVPLVAPEGGNAVRPQGKALTEAQGKDVVFYDRGFAANSTLNDKGTALQSGGQQLANKVPGVGNYATGEDFKLAKNAEELFLAAFLRKESGAAISDPEYGRYQRMFIPRPGDPPKVVEQLAENRRIALESVKAGLPPSVAAARVTESNPSKVTTQADYDALAPGMHYVDPFGKKRVKGGAP